jgi:hypothetical protein
MSPGDFTFVPIAVNEAAPGGACLLRTFDDIGDFILTNVAAGHRIAPHWQPSGRTSIRPDLERDAQKPTRRCVMP